VTSDERGHRADGAAPLLRGPRPPEVHDGPLSPREREEYDRWARGGFRMLTRGTVVWEDKVK